MLGLRLKRRESLSQLLGETGQEVRRGGVQNFEVNRPIAMDDPVAEPSRLRLRNLGEPVLDLRTELGCGLTQHGEVPQQCAPSLPIRRESFEVDTRHE